MRQIRRLDFIIPLALLLFAGLQTFHSFNNYGAQWLKATWRTRYLTAEQRNARFLIGTEGYQYIDFLKDSLPPDSTVVKPEGVGALSQQNNLQFLLLPRRIPICPCGSINTDAQLKACTECLDQGAHHVLSIANYPPAEYRPESKVFVAFPGESDTLHGYFAPPSSTENGMANSAIFDSSKQPVLGMYILEIVLLLALWAIGALAGVQMLSTSRKAFALLAGLPLGLGITTFSLFLLGWTGIPINTLTISVGIAAWLLSLAIIARVRQIEMSLGRELPSLKSIFQQKVPSLAIILIATVIITMLLASSLVISIGRSYSTYDGIANWALKGYAIAEFDTIFAGSDWGGHGLSYPQNIHLGTAIFRTLAGDVLPGSKLLHPIFFSMTVISLILFLYKDSRHLALSLVAGAFTCSLPFAFFHSTLGFANIIFSCYLVLATITLSQGFQTNQKGLQLLSSLLFGFASWTRPEGIFFSFVLIFLSVAHHYLSTKEIRLTGRILLPFVVIAGLWQVFGTRYQARDEIGRVLGDSLGSLISVDQFLASAQTLFRFAYNHLSQQSLWGSWWIPLMIVIILLIRNRSLMRQVNLQRLWLCAVALFLLPLSMFLAAGLAGYNLETWLVESFDRAMIPGIFMLLIASFSTIGAALNAELLEPSSS